MNKNLKYLIKVVKKASRLITNNLIVDSKDENNDLITNFDLKIETFISKKLLKKYPDFKIIGEEFSSNQNKTANYFTIDPIDGTINPTIINGIRKLSNLLKKSLKVINIRPIASGIIPPSAIPSTMARITFTSKLSLSLCISKFRKNTFILNDFNSNS